MELGLEGRVALISGASRGLGYAIARELALEGASVALVARGRDALEEAATALAAELGPGGSKRVL
ncbi:MAG TPA: SDR family NAD(P)-dependent oxidoreductase, partial [Gemmatimonadaceae bacterium]|nr:SDR family NAD(P)-dependent oxidoreductase [Gemmatimonadaceae bacterium]